MWLKRHADLLENLIDLYLKNIVVLDLSLFVLLDCWIWKIFVMSDSVIMCNNFFQSSKSKNEREYIWMNRYRHELLEKLW